MSTSISFFQGLWIKFRRRFVQYSILALKKPNWILMFVFGRIHIIRSFVLFISKRPFTTNYGKGHSVFEYLNVDNVVEILKNDGLYLDINIPSYLLKEILEFSSVTSYMGNGESQCWFSIPDKEKAEAKWNKKFTIGYNFDSSLLCPAIKKLENDPKLWEIAAKYLENDPVLIGSQVWWTFARQEAVNDRSHGFFRFHYDLEDYRFLKFMFYLTDVDLSSGCHICVKGSHKKKKLRYQFSLFRDRADKDIIDYYGSENVVTICGQAGSGFAEDPFCFHKGTIPVGKNRLILEIKFASNNYGRIL